MTTSTLTLPDYARLPECARLSWVSIELMDRVWKRAQTLFCPSDNSSDPDTGYRIEPFAAPSPATAHLYLIYKPRPKEGAPDYTESRYVYDAREQTCSCPFFCGVNPQHWHDSFEVRREGNFVRVYDREGHEVRKDKEAHGYCKHQLATLLLFAQKDEKSGTIGVITPERSEPASVQAT